MSSYSFTDAAVKDLDEIYETQIRAQLEDSDRGRLRDFVGFHYRSTQPTKSEAFKLLEIRERKLKELQIPLHTV
jgi:hypothetical protein